MARRTTQIQESSSPTQRTSSAHVNMDRVASLILCGGVGTRLFPLTQKRCKPALIFGGRYRLVDVPISSSINSGIKKIFVLTQYLATTLHWHINSTYRFDSFSLGAVRLLTAEQKHESETWFKGTADAVRQTLEYYIDAPVDYFLILSGDQLYNIHFKSMVHLAQETDADVVIATTPVDKENATRMGIMKTSSDNNILSFTEKPQEDSLLAQYYHTPKDIDNLGVSFHPGRHYLASMGIYLFKRQALIDLLANTSGDDFGKHLIPKQIQEGNAFAYLYNGYWEDIGTIESFFNANLSLTEELPKLNCYDEKRLIYSIPHDDLPPPKILNCKVNGALICDGVILAAQEVSHSIIGMRSIIREGCIIRDTYIMGNDYYNHPIRKPQGDLPYSLQISEGCRIERAILDKNVYLGKNVKLINKNKLSHFDGDGVYIRDGIIIVGRGVSLPDGFEL